MMIKKISRGTAADHNEHLRERMILYKLNGQSVVDVSEDDVKRRISQLGRPLTVTFVHRPRESLFSRRIGDACSNNCAESRQRHTTKALAVSRWEVTDHTASSFQTVRAPRMI